MEISFVSWGRDDEHETFRRRADAEAALRIIVDRDEFSATIAGERETANETRARWSSGEEDIRREKQRLDHIEAAAAGKSGHDTMSE
jgi:hypothetical protein